ncbi:hypothetical protein B0H11DRAFT_2187167 [Mycena galericulata]|nr:hypothetical protein B0H11DRAFT_2187167 [Mycena galericulata]
MALQCYNSYYSKVSYFGAIKFLTGSIEFHLETAARELQIRSIAKTCREPRSSKHDKVKIQPTFLPFEDGLYILAQGIVLSAFGWITSPSPLSIMRPPAHVHQLRPCCGDTPRCTAASWETSYSWPVKLLALAPLNPQRAPAGAYKQGQLTPTSGSKTIDHYIKVCLNCRCCEAMKLWRGLSYRATVAILAILCSVATSFVPDVEVIPTAVGRGS